MLVAAFKPAPPRKLTCWSAVLLVTSRFRAYNTAPQRFECKVTKPLFFAVSPAIEVAAGADPIYICMQPSLKPIYVRITC